MTSIPLWKRGIQEADNELIYYSSPTITGTAIIPEQVQTIQNRSGNIISRVSEPATKLSPTLAPPEIAKDILFPSEAPIISQAGIVTDFWKLLIGSASEKTEAVTKFIPADQETLTTITESIKAGGGEPGTNWQDQPMVTIPTVNAFEFPSIPWGDIGKWAGVGLIAVAGIYLLGSYLGRGK